MKSIVLNKDGTLTWVDNDDGSEQTIAYSEGNELHDVTINRSDDGDAFCDLERLGRTCYGVPRTAFTVQTCGDVCTARA